MKRFFIIILGILSVSLSTMAQTECYQSIKEGNRAFEHKDYKTAEKHYLKALHSQPRNSRIQFNLADTYLAQDNPQEALKRFAESAKTESNKTIKAMAYHNMGYIHHKAKDYDKAINYYKEALRNNPSDEDTRYNLALCQRQKKEQQQQQQQNQEQEKKEQQQNNQQQDPQQKEQKQQNQQSQMSQENVDQLLQLSRQAENQTRKKLEQQQPRKKSLPKNW